MRSSTSAPSSSSRPRPPRASRTCETHTHNLHLGERRRRREEGLSARVSDHRTVCTQYRYMRIDRLASLEPLFIDVTWGAVRFLRLLT